MYCRDLKLWGAAERVMATDAVSQKGYRELLVYVPWGGVVVDGGEGKMVYNGGSRKCVVMREGMGVEELRGNG